MRARSFISNLTRFVELKIIYILIVGKMRCRILVKSPFLDAQSKSYVMSSLLFAKFFEIWKKPVCFKYIMYKYLVINLLNSEFQSWTFIRPNFRAISKRNKKLNVASFIHVINYLLFDRPFWATLSDSESSTQRAARARKRDLVAWGYARP